MAEPVARVSPLTRGRGLKLLIRNSFAMLLIVAPHAGAWIETSPKNPLPSGMGSRPSRGGVD